EHGAIAQGDLVGGAVHLLRILGGEGVIGLQGGRVEFGQALHGVPVGGDRQRGGGGHRVVPGGAELGADGAGDGALLIRLLTSAPGIVAGRCGATRVVRGAGTPRGRPGSGSGAAAGTPTEP